MAKPSSTIFSKTNVEIWCRRKQHPLLIAPSKNSRFRSTDLIISFRTWRPVPEREKNHSNTRKRNFCQLLRCTRFPRFSFPFVSRKMDESLLVADGRLDAIAKMKRI
ncbi:hypothetical protein TNCV_4494751 [Trichonephila clavipes]|nr:hypothetical protein TNCV_4494751 [Trichonephila clavipes]